jgi:hypothetical protein
MKGYIFAILVIAMLAITGCSQILNQNENTINVAGDSELKFTPDQAEVWAGISIVKLTAEEAQTEANKAINAIIDGLRYKGISDKDISTDQLTLNQEYRWENNENKVVGWRATQILKIKTTDLTKVGNIVDIAVNNGANEIQSINFELSTAKETEYKKQALAEATKNAREKAQAVADSLGVKLGDIKSVSESNYYYTPRVYAMADKMGGAGAVAEASSVLPGDVSVTGHISIVYAVKQ